MPHGPARPGHCNTIALRLAVGLMQCDCVARWGWVGPTADRFRCRWGRKNFLVNSKNFLVTRQSSSTISYVLGQIGRLGVAFLAAAATLLRMTFKSLPLTVRTLRATEATLERIYNAAYLGLKEDSLALAAGMLPVEYRRLKELDPMAEMAELKGRADSESENSLHLLNAARAGDAKAALAILQHAHGWVAKQSVSIEVDQRISVIDALRAAESRVVDGQTAELIEAQPLTPVQAPRVESQNAKADL